MQKSVEKQMQAERLKIDLITNVSHDLKTPLTSMVGYTDLLKKEQPSEKQDVWRRHYISAMRSGAGVC